MSVNVSNLDIATIESIVLDLCNNLQIKDSAGNILPNYKHSAEIPYRYFHNDFSRYQLGRLLFCS